ncbi:MAG: glycosyl transferase family 2 [Verrucomicrobiales bacterium]|nr:glycosyl transferase family 2 [Verrucomicrobiales bacterium]|tara:strand:+ start:16547 stop:17491 length:945 start_codon:yes stop_codon:yes gene_type:complete
MSKKKPSISVIVAAPPGQELIRSVEAVQRMGVKLEIIIARGKQPSVQRNRAVAKAKGDLIYFLDDDSVPLKENLERAKEHFGDPAVHLVGGPNLCPADAPKLERAFGDVMGSWLAFGPSAARYRKIGKVRESSEKELILCNMMIRKSEFVDKGGFDEALYPNEENALMDAIQNDGGKLIYDPEFVVHRRPRSTMRAFMRMLMTYGRGRAEQFRLHPTLGSAPNFVPPLFCLYLLLTPFLPTILLWPLALYAFAVIAQALPIHTCIVCSLPRLIPLIVLCHVFYGLGFWKGLFTKLEKVERRDDVPVELERLATE